MLMPGKLLEINNYLKGRMIGIKNITILGIILILTYFIIGDTQLLTNYENYIFERKLERIVKSGAAELCLQELTDFEWDKACFYVHYNYKTNELDKRAGVWPITFYNKEKKLKEFVIGYSIIDLKPYTDLKLFFVAI
jgi:hypothetical protein